MFFFELKPVLNNKDIYNVEFLQQCKIKFESPKQKREIVLCAKCQRYGLTKNFCNLKPRSVKCVGNHTTEACSRKTKSRDVLCVLCGGNHPANYKGCTIYKELQEKQFPPLRPKLYTPPTYQQIQPGLLYSTVTSNQNSQHKCNNSMPITIENQFPQQPNDLIELKNMMKGLFEQISTKLNLHTFLLSKLK